MFDRFKKGLRDTMRSFLEIQEPLTAAGLYIQADLSHAANTALHKVLYRCDAVEAEQAFKKIDTGQVNRFWASCPSARNKIRKVRNDVYPTVVDTYADMIAASVNDPDFGEDQAGQNLFEEVFKEEQSLLQLTRKAVQGVLVTGDGAFKVSIDEELSDRPLVEFVDGEFVDYEYRRGRLLAVDFYTRFKEGSSSYVLKERYTRGAIDYELTRDGRPVPLESADFTAGLSPVTFAGDFIAAVPVMFWASPKYEGRGKPLFDSKVEELDALDEVVSQWVDAIRTGRVKTYIPEDLIPRTATGQLMRPNPFDNQFIATRASMSEQAGKIESVQPPIQYEAYLNSYVSVMDMVLTGIVSPATLGIDLKKISTDNATAQRERERITSWRRSHMADALAAALSETVCKALQMADNLQGGVMGDYDVQVLFDEYLTPDTKQKLELAQMMAPAGSQIGTWQMIADIVADDKTPEERKEIAEELAELNNPTIEHPEIFPTDDYTTAPLYGAGEPDTDEEEEEQAERPDTDKTPAAAAGEPAEAIE